MTRPLLPSGRCRRGCYRADVPIALPVLTDPNAPEKKEKCGVFGVWGTPDAAALTYTALFAQQHRGQESAGIAVTDGNDLTGHADMGLVSQVFQPEVLDKLSGTSAVGHVRYSTTGSSQWCNAQPLLQRFHLGPVAVAHNGNLINAGLIRREYEEDGAIFQTATDTEVIVHMLARPRHAVKPDPLGHVLSHLQGAFSLIFLFPDRIEAARDPWGIRPLSLGKTADGQWVVASETCAFDAIGATFERDLEPGEIVRIDDNGVTSRRYAEENVARARCAFELVYFANPASVMWGRNVHQARGDGTTTGEGSTGRRCRGRHADARQRSIGSARLCQGKRAGVRRSHSAQPLRRPHVHPAEPKAAGPHGVAEAQHHC